MNLQTIRKNHFLNKFWQLIHGEFVWIVSGQIVSVTGSIVGVKVITHLLSPDAYGELALALTINVLFLQLLFGPAINGIARFFSASKETGQLSSYLRAVRSILLKIYLVIFVVLIVAIFVLYNLDKINLILMGALTVLFSSFQGSNNLLDGIQSADRQRKVVAWHQAAGQWLKILIAYCSIKILGNTSLAVLCGFSISSLIILASQLWFFYQKILAAKNVSYYKSIEEKFWEKKILQFAWPFSVFGIFSWGQMSSDRWSLGKSASLEKVGLYNVLYQLGFYPMTLLGELLTQLVWPIFFSWAGDASDKERMKKVYQGNVLLTSSLFVITMILFVLSLFIHHFVFSITVAENYREISYLWPYLILAGGLYTTSQTATLSLHSSDKTNNLILPKLSSSVIGILLNFLAGALYGIEGVVASMLTISIISLLWSTLLMRKQIILNNHF